MDGESSYKRLFLFFSSLCIVAFGQAAGLPFLGLVASVGGFTLFFIYYLSIKSNRKRLFCSTIWFSCVQLVQLSWFISHPYSYIYFVWVGASLLFGMQFGFLAYFIRKKNIQNLRTLLGLSGLWVFIEWSRLFMLSGHSWNPIGMALAVNQYSLQSASLFGVYGLSFVVMFTNLLILKWYYGNRSIRLLIGIVGLVVFPYIFGFFQFTLNDQKNDFPTLSTLLVQPAFSVENNNYFASTHDYIDHVTDSWKHILSLLKEEKNKHTDFLVLPEFVVPFGAYTTVFLLEEVRRAFQQQFGDDSTSSFPPFTPLYAQFREGHWYVNNSFWAQTLSNYFQANVLIGLVDVEVNKKGDRDYFSASFVYRPNTESFPDERYEKRVLVPMGEYIPFSFCRKLASRYGVTGSFTPGTKSKVFSGIVPFSMCICYEETYGNLMRQNKQKGAKVLFNLTNDGWFPHSLLSRQHLEHAKLRTVENGIPLIRSCNTGITCAIDSFGRTIKELSLNDLPGLLSVQVPVITYSTLYSYTGDYPIISFSILCMIFLIIDRKRQVL